MNVYDDSAMKILFLFFFVQTCDHLRLVFYAYLYITTRTN